jgi:hypothetical protein
MSSCSPNIRKANIQISTLYNESHSTLTMKNDKYRIRKSTFRGNVSPLPKEEGRVHSL